MNTEAIKVLEERVTSLSSKRERLISLATQLKVENSLMLDTMNREVDSITYTISELKRTIKDFSIQDNLQSSKIIEDEYHD